jgi:ribosomal protein L37E
MCVIVPVRYDLSELSFIEEEPRTFNRKLDRISSKYEYMNFLSVNLSRECFTRCGLHLTKFGKDYITGCIAKRTRTYQWQTRTGDSKSLE